MPGPQLQLRTATQGDMELLFALLRDALGPYVAQTFGAWNDEEERARFFLKTDPATHQVVEAATDTDHDAGETRPAGTIDLRSIELFDGSATSRLSSVLNSRGLSIGKDRTKSSEIAAIVIHRSEQPATRKAILTVAVVADLLILGFFKYYDFFTDSLDRNLKPCIATCCLESLRHRLLHFSPLAEPGPRQFQSLF